ncbi:MAG: hypothetical protein GY862_35330 [Gammaproteobacteria bacterium]|nr:hypothetical protein [Gammaproteobacteria bacterium]
MYQKTEYYEILGLSPDAGHAEIIEKGGQRLAEIEQQVQNAEDPREAAMAGRSAPLGWYPRETFKNAKEAFAILSDPARRKAYDTKRSMPRPPHPVLVNKKTKKNASFGQILILILAWGALAVFAYLYFLFTN